MSEQTKTFQIGDTVTWTSQAGGKAKTKTGKVIAVVPKGANVRQWVPDGFNDSRLPQNLSFRFHESYLIQVGKSKRLYWPLVKYLKRPEPSPLEQYKREAEPWNVDTEDDDPMMPGEGCGYDAVDVGDGSNPDL